MLGFSFWSRCPDFFVRLTTTCAKQHHLIDQTSSGITNFFLKRHVAIERFMTARVRLVIPDVPIQDARAARLDELHIVQPINQ